MTRKIMIVGGGKGPRWGGGAVGSKGRGRPIADFVERLEQTHPGFPSKGDLSGAALRAGDLVRSMRKEAGLSQTDLADRMGVKQSRISEIEAGLGSQGPTWDVMERAATACGQSLRPVMVNVQDKMRTAAEKCFGGYPLTFVPEPMAAAEREGLAISRAATVYLGEVEGRTCLFVEMKTGARKNQPVQPVKFFPEAVAFIKP
jgi:transcriptional regulator with XRE-family HTH domain